MSDPLTNRSPFLVKWFVWYVRRYLARNFHAVRLARDGRPADPAGPLVVVLNHPSWWDPLIVALLTELFPARRHFGPIDARALGKYRFFERLGFFGVEQGTREGALHFLRTSQAVLAEPGTALWVTAQGEFTDPRTRPVRLRAGVGHLLHRLAGGTVLPLAVEYPFWNERYPEALVRFGAPIPVTPGRAVEDWMARLETAVTRNMDDLAGDAAGRDPARFDTLVGGATGVGGVYDLWRRAKATLRGERFDRGHGFDNHVAALDGSP